MHYGNGGESQALRYDAGVSVDLAMRRGADFLLIALLLLFCFCQRDKKVINYERGVEGGREEKL